jgi:hypothetical protein
MMRIFAKTRVRVWGTRNSWSLSPESGLRGSAKECDVELEIQGNDREGYNFVMSPTGFFTADTWHQTKDEALATAKELFGVGHAEWKEKTEEPTNGGRLCSQARKPAP